MLSLGIESTAHTFGVGIVDESCRVLANEKHSHTTMSGGLIPRELAIHHDAWALPILKSALEKSGVTMGEIDVVAFSQGPGIGPALRIGALTARSLALQFQKPLLGVNHCVGHIELGKALTGAADPLIVYASGGNTQIIGLDRSVYRVFGETLDIGIGNLLDSFGRELGMGFPAGPKLDSLYFEGKKLVSLPYSVKGMDLVFSGLLTAATKKIGVETESDLAYSLLHTSFAMLTEVSERALAQTKKKELLLTGGVASSKALQEMMKTMCHERGVKLLVPPSWGCTDSGLLPAWLGLVEYRSGIRMKLSETGIQQRQRTDSIVVSWQKQIGKKPQTKAFSRSKRAD